MEGSPFDASQHSHSPLEAEQDKDLTELFTLLDAHPPVVPPSQSTNLPFS